MGGREAKDRLYESFALVGGALSSGRRLELVDVLSQGERSVEELATELGQSVANTSSHLRSLAHAGLVETRRDGNRVIYRLASDRVAELWAAVRDVAASHVARLDRVAADYLGDRGAISLVTRTELAGRLGDPNLALLDVRPPREFVAGHIPGARSVPPQDLTGGLRLPRGSEAIAYCRGPYCVYADDAVRFLRRRGVRARRLEDGFPEWRRAGLPVAVGEEEAVSRGGAA